MCMFLNRSRFVSRATIERNRALELSLRFARHPSIKIVQWSFSFLLFFFFSSLEKFPFFFLIRVCIQNIECTRESRIITIYKRRVILIISMEEDEHFFFYYFYSYFFASFPRDYSRHERNLWGRLIVESRGISWLLLAFVRTRIIPGKTGWKRRNEPVQFYFYLGDPFSSSTEPRNRVSNRDRKMGR